MRTAAHIALILAIGLGLGLAIRVVRNPLTPESDATRVVYTNAPEAELAEPGPQAEPMPESEPSLAPEGWMSEFELTERSGKKVTSDELKGTPYVVSFFFSTCPSICIQQNQKVEELQSMFADQGVRFVSISVDPKTDDPATLREYAARFNADDDQWLFMTGDLNYIRRVGAEVFRLAVDEKFHTEKFVLVGKQGEIIGYYAWPEKRQYEQLKSDIRKLLDSPS
ncbi:MAG: SCO family protein [Planctomycetaceae bacterium]